MIFEKDKYYKYIQRLERRLDYYYVIIIGTAMIIATILYYEIGLIIAIITIIIGIILSNYLTLKIKILIQEMRMKMDIYERIKQKI